MVGAGKIDDDARDGRLTEAGLVETVVVVVEEDNATDAIAQDFARVSGDLLHSIERAEQTEQMELRM